MRGSGTVVQDNRTKAWMFLWWENGKRKSKNLGQHPTRTSAWRSAKPYRDALETKPVICSIAPTVRVIVEQYRAEKMPPRISTRRAYEHWIENYILPQWGDVPITDLQARPTELWLDSLNLAPKSRAHIRGLLHTIWDFTMWAGHLPTQRNPIELVTVKGASKRTRQPRSLTVDEFQKFAEHLREPFRTIAVLCVCFGLRISECLALKWSDVDWNSETLTVTRGIVCQNVDDVKTENSRKALPVAAEILDILRAWKQTSQFSATDDWLFASPVKIGRLPFSYTGILHIFQKAAKDAGIGSLGTHTMRHSYRSWLDSTGAPVGVQQKLMRHADVRTTMNQYGQAFTADMQAASEKVAALALNGL